VSVPIQTRMWRVARKLEPAVAVADLAQLADVSDWTARQYLERLRRAGYCKRRDDGEYLLTRNTGPNPPEELTIHALRDRNDGSVHVHMEKPCGALEAVCRARATDVLAPVMAALPSDRRKFSLSKMVETLGLPRRPVMRVLDRLVREGVLEVAENAKQAHKARAEYGPAKRDTVYRRVPGAGLARGVRQTRGENSRDRIWRTIRRLRRFTKHSLAEASGCKFASCEEYVRLLTIHNHLVKDGREGRRAVFVLANDTGVRRPATPEVKG